MLKRLLRYTRNFFNFSFAEAKGFVAMAGILAVLSLTYLLYDSSSSAGYTTFQEDQAKLDSLLSLLEQNETNDSLFAGASGLPKKKEGKTLRTREAERFYFNPRRLPVDSLVLLGIPLSIARRIDNYRKKGGKFRKREDLLKIYGFPDSLFTALEPLITLPVSKERAEKTISYKNEPQKSQEKTISSSFNINKADSLQLISLKGIGPVLSSRLIRFREKLGGFVQKAQLYEVYGLDSLVVENLLAHSFIEEGFVPEKIHLNSVSQEKLAEHPYIKPVQARLIVAYRSTHGPFQSIGDLQKIHTSDPDFIEKIAPYISLE